LSMDVFAPVNTQGKTTNHITAKKIKNKENYCKIKCSVLAGVDFIYILNFLTRSVIILLADKLK